MEDSLQSSQSTASSQEIISTMMTRIYTEPINYTNFTWSYEDRNISNSTKPSLQNQYDYFNTILLTMMALIFVIGTTGNAVVCYVFGFKQHKRRSVPETLFLYLGAIDLTSSIINPALYIYWTVTKYSRWDFGIVGCKLLAPLAPVSVTLSALIILIIAVDRYFVICGQFGRSYSRNRIHCAVLFAAIFSVCLFLPYIILLEVSEDVACGVSTTQRHVSTYSMITALIFQDASFIVVLSFTNAKTFKGLKKQTSVRRRLSVDSRRLMSHKRVSRILLAMSCVFCLLVLPRDLVQLSYMISWLNPPGLPYTPTLLRINAFLKVLQTANSCVNVFIYSKMHTKFRVHLFSMCYKAFGKQSLLSSKFNMAMTTEEMTPKSRRKVFKFMVGNETPSDTPELPRKQLKPEKVQDKEGMNPLLINHITKARRVQFRSETFDNDFP